MKQGILEVGDKVQYSNEARWEPHLRFRLEEFTVTDVDLEDSTNTERVELSHGFWELTSRLEIILESF